MSVRRVVPDLHSTDPIAARSFYEQVLGMEVAMDLGWIVTFRSRTHPAAQVSVMATDTPDLTVEVDDVDAVHEAVVAAGFPVVSRSPTNPGGCDVSSRAIRPRHRQRDVPLSCGGSAVNSGGSRPTSARSGDRGRYRQCAAGAERSTPPHGSRHRGAPFRQGGWRMRTALVLKREPLAELTGEELAGVVGGSTFITPAVVTAIIRDLVSADGACL